MSKSAPVLLQYYIAGDGGRSSRPLLGACPVKVHRFESKLNDIPNKDYSTTKLRSLLGFSEVFKQMVSSSNN